MHFGEGLKNTFEMAHFSRRQMLVQLTSGTKMERRFGKAVWQLRGSHGFGKQSSTFIAAIMTDSIAMLVVIAIERFGASRQR